MFEWFKFLVRNSAHIHAKQSNFAKPVEAIAIIDRFLDGKSPAYSLEWDDFISWKNVNPSIEEIRRRIAATEPMFLSKEPAQLRKATDIVLRARNELAAKCGASAKAL
jgi:hypothetical protein